LPQFFNILVEETGQPEQWLSEVDVPGGDYQAAYGYEKLPLTTSHGSAAVFSSNQYNNLVSTIVLDDVLTTVYAAVEGSAIGNTIVQLYPAAHFPSGVENYTISMAENCALSISCFGAHIEKGISHMTIRETIAFVVFVFTN
jgi:hypothetical protein